MKPADLRKGDDPATWREVDVSGLGTVVVERLVGTHGVVAGHVGAQKPVEMSLVQDEDMGEAPRRMEPITRSTKGFCQGARGAVRTSRMSMLLTRRANASP
jgi:hypothetical protein